MKIALATCSKLPEPDADEALLVGALQAQGATVRLLAWDGPSSAAAPDELVVLRSTWNYFEDVERFLGWVEQTGRSTRLFNPASVVRANARKTYLRQLEARGIDIVPTEYVARSEARSIEEIIVARGWDAVVVKPVVSAGSFLTQRFEAAQTAEAQLFLEELTATRDAMIQRWMPAVDTHGERSLVWIDGGLSHAIRKSPRFTGQVESVSSELPIAPEERAFAEKVLAPIAKDILYARVDIVRDDDEVLRLMELELIEPSLFLRQCPRALDRFAQAIARRARS
ncbi:MAG TPA: hypothetical protein VM925_32545 [Labilithrix sp.]|nr:hypothetical protein [Labilithrix sp.]